MEYEQRFPTCRMKQLKGCPDGSASIAWDYAGLPIYMNWNKIENLIQKRRCHPAVPHDNHQARNSNHYKTTKTKLLELEERKFCGLHWPTYSSVSVQERDK